MHFYRMFSKLFNCYFENIPLVRACEKSLSESDNKSNNSLLTLGEVVRSCDFLLLYIMSSAAPQNPAFLQSLQKVISIKNQQGTDDSKSSQRNSSPAKLRRLFKLSSKKCSAEQEQICPKSKRLEVVVIDVRDESIEANLGFISDYALLYCPPQPYMTKSRFLRSLHFVNAPSLYILDCADLTVLSQSYRSLMDDPSGVDFPWPNVQHRQLFDGLELLRNTENGKRCKIAMAQLTKGIKGLFFGAKWCPPSKLMLGQLVELYTKIKHEHPQFEIIFCSSDRSEESFNEHFSLMPWLALPYGNEKLNQKIAKTYDICGIPSFILINEDFSLLTRNGRSVCLSDPHGYPWKRKALYELTEHTVHRLSEMPSLILFTEGSAEDIEFSCKILNPCAESLFAQQNFSPQVDSASPSNSEDAGSVDSDRSVPSSLGTDSLQFFFTGEDPICDHILESLSQDHADLPLLLICDPLSGNFAICDQPEVSEPIVLAFVSDYRNGRAKVLPIPDTKQQSTHQRTVGGIPVQLLEPFLPSNCLQQQQQQHVPFTKSA